MCAMNSAPFAKFFLRPSALGSESSHIVGKDFARVTLRHKPATIRVDRGNVHSLQIARLLQSRSSAREELMAIGSGTDWLRVFEEAFQADSQLAENAARLWQGLLNQIEAGPDGLRDAREFLQSAIRFAFQYTDAFRLCRDQFEASLNSSDDSADIS